MSIICCKPSLSLSRAFTNTFIRNSKGTSCNESLKSYNTSYFPIFKQTKISQSKFNYFLFQINFCFLNKKHNFFIKKYKKMHKNFEFFKWAAGDILKNFKKEK